MALCGPCARCVHYKNRSKKEKAFLFPVPENWLFFRNLDIPWQPPCEFIIASLSLFLIGPFLSKACGAQQGTFLVTNDILFGVSDLPPMNVRFYTSDCDLTSIPAAGNNQTFPVSDF